MWHVLDRSRDRPTRTVAQFKTKFGAEAYRVLLEIGGVLTLQIGITSWWVCHDDYLP